MTTTENVTNGMDLPPARVAVIDQAQRIHQEVAHERDELRKLVGELKADISGYKIALDARETQITDMQSRMESLTLTRDQKVAEAEQHKAVLRSISAQLRAFDIEAEPLVREKVEPVFDGS